MSGIEVDSVIATLFNEMKLRSVNKWATFKIESKKKVVVDEKGDPKVTEDRTEDKDELDLLKPNYKESPVMFCTTLDSHQNKDEISRNLLLYFGKYY